MYLGRPGHGLPAFERGGRPAIISLIEEIRERIAGAETRALAAAVQPA